MEEFYEEEPSVRLEHEFRCSFCEYSAQKKRTFWKHIIISRKHKQDKEPKGTAKLFSEVNDLFDCNLCEYKAEKRNTVMMHVRRNHSSSLVSARTRESALPSRVSKDFVREESEERGEPGPVPVPEVRLQHGEAGHDEVSS